MTYKTFTLNGKETAIRIFDSSLPNLKAILVKDITGAAIETIPAGTEFIIFVIGDDGISTCAGLAGCTCVYNDEYILVD